MQQSYPESRLKELLPILMTRVELVDGRKFVFSHPKFPDLRFEGLTIIFMEEELERVIRRLFKKQSKAHVDYLYNFLSKE